MYAIANFLASNKTNNDRTATTAIKGLKSKFGGSALFGNEKDDSFQGSLAAVYQTFSGQYLYPGVEEKAANLLYFVVKTIPSQMEINGSPLSCLFGSLRRMPHYTVQMDRRSWQTTLWSH